MSASPVRKLEMAPRRELSTTIVTNDEFGHDSCYSAAARALNNMPVVYDILGRGQVASQLLVRGALTRLGTWDATIAKWRKTKKLAQVPNWMTDQLPEALQYYAREFDGGSVAAAERMRRVYAPLIDLLTPREWCQLANAAHPHAPHSYDIPLRASSLLWFIYVLAFKYIPREKAWIPVSSVLSNHSQTTLSRDVSITRLNVDDDPTDVAKTAAYVLVRHIEGVDDYLGVFLPAEVVIDLFKRDWPDMPGECFTAWPETSRTDTYVELPVTIEVPRGLDAVKLVAALYEQMNASARIVEVAFGDIDDGTLSDLTWAQDCGCIAIEQVARVRLFSHNTLMTRVVQDALLGVVTSQPSLWKWRPLGTRVVIHGSRKGVQECSSSDGVFEWVGPSYGTELLADLVASLDITLADKPDPKQKEFV